jgi:conjugal transfer pilus assembly protein TraI
MKFSLKKPEELLREVMASSGMLDHIRNESGCTAQQYADRYLEPMHRIASFVLEIPASAKHHKEPGGAIRFAVESGFFALRIADSTIFTANLSSEQRRDIEPQYRYGTFIAALCSNIHRSAAYFDIISDDGEVWSEFDGSISLWLKKIGTKSYNLKWKSKPADTNKQVAMFLAKEILDSCCSHLNPQTIRDIIGSVAPDEVPSGHEPLMTRVVRQSLQTSIDMDIKRASLTYTEPANIPLPTAELVDKILPKASPPSESAPSQVVIEDYKAAQHSGVIEVKEPIPVAAPALELGKLPEIKEQDSADDDNELFAVLDPSVREMLIAIADDVRTGGRVAKRIKWEKDGLSIPVELLGDYGLASSSVVSALKKVNGIRRKDGSIIVLDQKLGNKIMKRPLST